MHCCPGVLTPPRLYLPLDSPTAASASVIACNYTFFLLFTQGSISILTQHRVKRLRLNHTTYLLQFTALKKNKPQITCAKASHRVKLFWISLLWISHWELFPLWHSVDEIPWQFYHYNLKWLLWLLILTDLNAQMFVTSSTLRWSFLSSLMSRDLIWKKKGTNYLYWTSIPCPTALCVFIPEHHLLCVYQRVVLMLYLFLKAVNWKQNLEIARLLERRQNVFFYINKP